MWETELRVYKRVKDELKSKYPEGGFVVILHDKIAGVWAKRVDALKAGYEIYGHANFFVGRL